MSILDVLYNVAGRQAHRRVERLLSRFFSCKADHNRPRQARYNLGGVWLCRDHAERTIADGSLD